DAAVGIVAVRRVLRGLPGEDRHPVDPRAPARARGARDPRGGTRRARGDGGDGTRLRRPAQLRGRPANGQARPRATGRRGPAAVEGLARAAGGARADLPRVVAVAMSARDDVLARVRAALRDVPRDEDPVPEAYQAPASTVADVVGRFVERVSDYRATVREAG